MSGQRFFNLKVVKIHHAKTDDGRVQWVCRCDCGKTKIYPGKWLRAGFCMSCGCLKKSRLGAESITHGKSGTPEYRTWGLINSRCRNPKDTGFKNYGGRGINICERWRKFENFLADMGLRPTPHHSIERIDNDGDYEPSNCRWATRKEQARNRRGKAFRALTFRSKTRTIAEWSELTGIHSRTIRARIDVLGWSIEEALTKPV